jgi:uncharacterized protein
MIAPLTESEIDDLLNAQLLGHLGCADAGKPYVFPMAYVYHHNILYGQTTVGKKIDIMRRNPAVCFQVQDVGNAAWRSVQCWGTFEELDFEKLEGAEAGRIVQLLSRKLGSIQRQVGIGISFSGGDHPTPMMVNGKATTLFRIILHEKSGLCRRDLP